jgi:hypothetical protein
MYWRHDSSMKSPKFKLQIHKKKKKKKKIADWNKANIA